MWKLRFAAESTARDAYMIASRAGDLKLAGVIAAPHGLVTMHMPKAVIGR